MSDLKIIYPFTLSNYALGTAWYPYSDGRISIYLANHLRLCRGNPEEVVEELNITILEEISHIFAGRSPSDHDWDDFLRGLVK
jgi:hypothetical protein